MNSESSPCTEASAAIRRLVSFYSDAVRRKDPDSAGCLFLADAHVIIMDGPERIGREAIVEGLRQTLSGFSFLHQRCDTGMIEVDGERARARVGVMEANRQAGSDQLGIIFGTYEDEYRSVEGIWHFERRRFVLQFRAVLPTVEMQDFGPFSPTFEIAR